MTDPKFVLPRIVEIALATPVPFVKKLLPVVAAVSRASFNGPSNLSPAADVPNHFKAPLATSLKFYFSQLPPYSPSISSGM